MKRQGNLKSRIIDYDNIVLAVYKSFRGKRHKNDVKRFCRQFDSNISLIISKLKDLRVNFGHYHYFKIFEPKERFICAASFNERIIHHALMNVCNDIFERHFIYDTYATRKRKGGYAAIERLHRQMSYYDYYVKLDVRKYFDNISHEVLKKSLRRLFKDKWLLSIFDQIIDSYCIREDRGLPIGNLTSQYFANYYLSCLDHHMKECEHVAVYVRYMDDIVLLSDSLAVLKKQTEALIDFCQSKLRLQMKPPIFGKSILGVNFLGYRISRYHIGLNSKSRRRFKYKMKLNENLISENHITESAYALRVQSLMAFIEKAQSKQMRYNYFKRIDVLRAPTE